MKKQVVLHMQNFSAPYPGNFMRCINALEKGSKYNNSRIVYLFPEAARKLDWMSLLLKSGKNIYFRNNRILDNIFLLNKIIKKEKIDIIHVHFWSSKDLAELLILKRLNKRLKTIIHHHNHYFPSNNSLKEGIRTLLLKKNDMHIGVTHSVTESVTEAGVDPNKALSVINAIDFSRLDSFESISLKELGVDSDSKKVLMFGYDYIGKGVDKAVAALEKICYERNITLLLLMAKNKEVGISKIKERFGEFPKWIKVLEPRNDIASYYRMADVFLSASRQEGFCYSLVEAAYCECRLVASDIPGQNSLKIPYTIQYPVEDVEALKNALLEAMYGDEDIKLQLTEEAKEYVIKNYSLQEWENEIWKVYSKI